MRKALLLILALAMAAMALTPVPLAQATALASDPALRCAAGPPGESPALTGAAFEEVDLPGARRLAAGDGFCPLFYLCLIRSPSACTAACSNVRDTCLGDPDCTIWECREQQRDCFYCCTYGQVP